MDEDVELKMDTFDCILNGKRIELTLQEGQFLRLLASNPGRVVPFSSLVREVWDDHIDWAYVKSLHNIAWRVRKKLGSKDLIKLRMGMGYMLSSIVKVSWIGKLNFSPPALGPTLESSISFKAASYN